MLRVLALLLSFLSGMAFVSKSGVAHAQNPGSQIREPLRVVFISPEAAAGREFWVAFTAFMRRAASDLGIDLRVEYANTNRFLAVKLAHDAVQAPTPPHYLVHIYQLGQGRRMLSLADKAGVRTFTVNTGVPREEADIVGSPRGLFPRWLGQMYPDDVAAGRELALYLTQRARDMQLQGAGENVQVVAISGSRNSRVAFDRNQGLLDAIGSQAGVKLNQVLFTEWIGVEAAEKMPILMHRYPHTSVVWSASDMMALAIANSMKDLGKQVGRDVVLGGIDGIPAAIDAIDEGLLEATLIGHFMEGAWALVLLYDHYHGIDFNAAGTTFRSQMSLVTKTNLERYRQLSQAENWKKIDFRRFSKTYNPELNEYSFTADAVLDMINEAQ